MNHNDLNTIVLAAQSLGMSIEELKDLLQKKVYLVRHAPTIYNGENEKIRSVVDLPLDEAGLTIANNTGIALRDADIDCIYSSELKRAKQTAKAIYLNGAKKIELLSGLNAWNLGSLAGEISNKTPDQTQNLVDNPEQLPPDSNESYNSFKNRTLNAYKEAIKYEGNIAIVSHYSNCRAIMEFLGINQHLQPGEFIKI